MITTLITVQYTDRRVRSALYLGRQGETGARQIVFDLSDMIDDFGPGTVTLLHMRSKDPAPYIISETAVTAAAPTVTWDITDTDTEQYGYGLAELRLAFDGDGTEGEESLAKSVLYGTVVYKALTGGTEIPDPLQSWYDALIEYIDEHGGGGGGGDNTTYTISISGRTITLTGSDRSSVSVTVPDTDLSDYMTSAAITAAISAAVADKYVKPAGGIPATDMASAVQTSLGKADTALQTAPVSSVNSRTGAVTGLQEQTTVVNKTASDTSQTLAENTFYIWPEMSALTITCPTTGGPFAFRFTSGATATTLTMTGITMPDDFAVEANKVYEVNVYEGYGLAVSWS